MKNNINYFKLEAAKEGYLQAISYNNNGFQQDFVNLLYSGDVELLISVIDSLQLTEEYIKPIFEANIVKLVRNDCNLPTIKYLVKSYNLKSALLYTESNGTPLHEAVTYSSVETIKYLLEMKVSLGVKNIFQQTPLHNAASTGDFEIIQLLMEAMNKQDVNVKNINGNTFMHLIAAGAHYEQIPTIKTICSNKIIPKIKNNDGHTYLDLRDYAKQGLIRFGNSNTLYTIPEYDQESVVATKFFYNTILGINSEENAPKYIESTLKTIKLCQNFLFGDKATKESFKEQLIKKSIAKVNIIWDFYYSEDNISATFEYLKIILSLWSCEEEKIHLANTVFTAANENGNYALAKSCIKEAIGFYNQHSEHLHLDNEQKAALFYNYAKSMEEDTPQEALVYYQLSYECNPDDLEIIECIYKIYWAALDYENAFYTAELITDSEIQKLYKFYADLTINRNIPLDVLLEQYEFDNFKELYSSVDLGGNGLLYLDILNCVHVKREEYELAYYNTKEFLSKIQEPALVSQVLFRALHYLNLISGSTDEALSLVDQYDDTYSAQRSYYYNKDLNYYKLIFYIKNDSSDKIEHLNDILGKKLVIQAYQKCFVDSYTSPEIAEKLLIKLEELVVNNSEYHDIILWYRNLFNEIVEKTVIETAPEVQTIESVSHIDLYDISHDDFDFSSLTNLEIHQYFQSQKKQLDQKPLEPIHNQSKSDACWNVNNLLYDSSYNDVVEIKPNYYAVIDQDVFSHKRIDSTIAQQFTDALSKGLCSRKWVANGVKFIPKKLVELKIDGEARLYTNFIYKNLEGKYLIVFDKFKANKTDMRKKIKDSTLKTILVDSYLLDDTVPTNEIMYDDNDRIMGDIDCDDSFL